MLTAAILAYLDSPAEALREARESIERARQNAKRTVANLKRSTKR